jgi:PAS domain S-box-containing protein
MADQSCGGVELLHVDDDGAFLELVATHLEAAAERFEVATESDPERALERLRSSPPDCVVSDYEMPTMDGLELLRAVRETHRELPFVLFTGKGSEEIASEAVSAGVTDYIQKGGSTEKFELLANRVQNAVEGYRAEAAFDREHEKLTTLFDNSPDAIVEYRLEGEAAVVESVNSAFERTFGCDREAVVGEPVEALIVPESRREAARGLNRRAQGQGPFRREVWREAADGPRDFLLTSIPVPSADRGYAVYTDVSEARERERRLETLISNVPGVVYRREPAEPWAMEFVSGDAEELTGHAPGAFESGPVNWTGDVVHPDDRPGVGEAMQEALAAGEPFEVTYRIRTSDGTERWCWEQGRGVQGGDGELDAIEGYVTDITDYRSMVTTLQAARSRLEDPAGADVEAARECVEDALRSARIDTERLVVDYER